MATKEEVQRFLNQMREKIKVFGIIYRDDRGKNAQTLIDLEITPKKRTGGIYQNHVGERIECVVHLVSHSRTPHELPI